MNNKKKKEIEEYITTNKIMLFMKGVPSAPQCGFSNTVVTILNSYGIEYGACNILENPAVREGIKEFSDWPTLPQLYIGGEFMGGCDIIIELHNSGALGEKLASLS